MRTGAHLARIDPEHIRDPLVGVATKEQAEQGALVLGQRHGGLPATLLRTGALAALLAAGSGLALGLLEQLVEAELGDLSLEHRCTDEGHGATRVPALLLQRLEGLLYLLRLLRGRLREADRLEGGEEQDLLGAERNAPGQVAACVDRLLAEREGLVVRGVEPEQVALIRGRGGEVDGVGLQGELGGLVLVLVALRLSRAERHLPARRAIVLCRGSDGVQRDRRN